MLSLTESHPLRIQTSKGLSISSAFIIFVLASFFRSCVLFPFVYQDMMFVFLFASLLNAQFLQKKSPFDWNQVCAQCNFFSPSGASASRPPTLNQKMKTNSTNLA